MHVGKYVWAYMHESEEEETKRGYGSLLINTP
jgi:hypothetical protein